ncbi:MAG: DUF3052 domain-containing protein [Blastocatellia bacterium]|nr:DUF3052 domain-containing protein [Blastocatellia bacterium]
MAGYSGTALAKKLGIKEGFRIALIGAPSEFEKEIGALPAGAEIVSRRNKSIDLILFFAKTESGLTKDFAKLVAHLAPAGGFWVAWPKKSSGVPSDLSFAIIQKVGLASGLVDTKICAVNDVWSGLRFVIRLKDRTGKR